MYFDQIHEPESGSESFCKCTPNILDATAGIVSHTLPDHHPYFIIFRTIRAPPPLKIDSLC